MRRESNKRLNLILEHHPTLALTPLQREIWQAALEAGAHPWKAAFSRARGVTVQDITNVSRIVGRKISAATDLVRLWDGEISYFFEQHGGVWGTSRTRQMLWPLLRPTRTLSTPMQQMVGYFVPLQVDLLRAAMRLLRGQERQWLNERRLDPATIALAYDLFVSSAYVDPQHREVRAGIEEFSTRRGRTSWLLWQFSHGTLPYVRPELVEDFRSWLKMRIQRLDQPAKSFAHYLCGYYGGTRPQEMDRVIMHDAAYAPRFYDYEPLLRRLAGNMARFPYCSSGVWSDHNFLSLILIARIFPLRSAECTPQGRHHLLTLCQRALHSTDPFIAREAEHLLAGLTQQ